ncbi:MULTISPECIES: YbjQ family protein [unclassified Burkholderia]|uniref:YbjQ family protein n=1 Tax=unclassified Burkholderia TaxID=2613784 RepID=UPI001422205A|nr:MULTISPECIES: YbjQ family protein [unclassified Burkholderia]NIE55653.1 YbjQ family protein [Burkholderia sp. Ap-955]NIF11703.1 YbjQ family protein [Burkholderia sp. Ax-1735]NIG05150.1 YbjQ family protein [Burkholderia sp. Tr-849]
MTDISRSFDDLTPERVTTAFDLPGHTTIRSLGVAQGIIVRSRSIVGSFGASLQTLFGGNITLYTSLCEKARQQAFDKMLGDARKLGANAIVAMRYDSTEIGAGVTEVICYGTAVRVARDAGA